MTDSRHAGYIGRSQYRRDRRIDTWRLALARHRRTGEWIGKGGCVEAWHRRKSGTGAQTLLRSAPPLRSAPMRKMDVDAIVLAHHSASKSTKAR